MQGSARIATEESSIRPGRKLSNTAGPSGPPGSFSSREFDLKDLESDWESGGSGVVAISIDKLH